MSSRVEMSKQNPMTKSRRMGREFRIALMMKDEDVNSFLYRLEKHQEDRLHYDRRKHSRSENQTVHKNEELLRLK